MQKIQCGACETIFAVDEEIDAEVPCPNCQRRLRITATRVDESQPIASSIAGIEPIEQEPKEATLGEAPQSIQRALANTVPSNPNAGTMQASPKSWMVKDKQGREFGPLQRESLDDLARARTLTCECRVRRQTSPVWLWAVEVFPELADEPPIDKHVRHVPPNSDDEEMPPEADVVHELVEPAHQEHHHGDHPHHHHRSKMLSHRGPTILMLGLLSFLCGMFGIGAAVMGMQDIRTMRHGDMDPLGYDQTLWGAILGVIGTLAQCGLVAYLWTIGGK